MLSPIRSTPAGGTLRILHGSFGTGQNSTTGYSKSWRSNETAANVSRWQLPIPAHAQTFGVKLRRENHELGCPCNRWRRSALTFKTPRIQVEHTRQEFCFTNRIPVNATLMPFVYTGKFLMAPKNNGRNSSTSFAFNQTANAHQHCRSCQPQKIKPTTKKKTAFFSTDPYRNVVKFQ